jgi:hypothetical protein
VQAAEKPPTAPWTQLSGILAAIAGLAGLIYVTGGVVLTLRLYFDGLPPVAVVGQLPRDFLFAVGASQVVIPALGLGVAHAIYSNTINDIDLQQRSYGWCRGRLTGKWRTRHLLSTAVLPMALLLPAVWLSLHRQESTETIAWVVLVVAALAAVVIAFVLHNSLKRPEGKATRMEEKDKKKLTLPELLFAVSGLWASLLIGGAVLVVTNGHDFRFLWGLPLAWAACAVVAAAYIQTRAAIARAYEGKHREVLAQTLLSLAAALVTVPGLIALAAALRIEDATVCTKTRLTSDVAYVQRGKFVGETNERVYLGTEHDPGGSVPLGVPAPNPNTLTSIPKSEIARIVIGPDQEGTVACEVAPAKP